MVMATHVKSRPTNHEEATELIDTLIAISVVAKRLAEKLRQKDAFKEGNPSEEK